MYRPARIRPHRVPGPPRVSPWAMIRRLQGARVPAPTNQRASGPECTYPGRAVGPVDHSPGRNPGRRNPGAYRIRPPNGPHGPEWMNAQGRVFATDGGARWGVCNTPLHGYPDAPAPTPKRINNSSGRRPPTPKHLNKPTGRRPQQFTGPCGPPLQYDHIAISPLISFSTPPKSVLSLWKIFT